MYTRHGIINQLAQRQVQLISAALLDRAIQTVAAILARLAPRSPEQPRRLTAAGETSAILETKHKAIRAALLAGVKPGQVAKHFGVPLAAVRKVASET